MGDFEMIRFPSKYLVVGTLFCASLIGLSTLLAWRADAAQPESYFIPVPVSINAMMVALVDHSAHEIWDAGNASTLTGRDWQNVEQHTIQLAAAGSLISTGGTGTADYGWVMSPRWQEWARVLTDGALQANRAVQEQDKMALVSAGDAILQACEGCHQIFKPDVPTEGILHIPHYD